MANICLSTLLNHIDNLLNKIFFWEGGGNGGVKTRSFYYKNHKINS
jgi:hypothetical protein